MSFELDPLHLFYGFAALAAVLVVEAVYLLFHNTQSYRTRVNRRLDMSSKESDREKVLVQLRRERGLSADGGYALPIAAFNRLVLQSGAKVQPARVALMLALAGLLAFLGVFIWRGEVVEALGGTAFGVTVVPLVALMYMRRRRQKAFGTQFPEAIDVIVRSLRAATRPPSPSRWSPGSFPTRSAPSSAWWRTRSPTGPISKGRCGT
jgi:tight adherence protein B